MRNKDVQDRSCQFAESKNLKNWKNGRFLKKNVEETRITAGYVVLPQLRARRTKAFPVKRASDVS